MYISLTTEFIFIIRRQCLLPLKLALESRASKLSLHAVNGLQVGNYIVFQAIFESNFDLQMWFVIEKKSVIY